MNKLLLLPEVQAFIKSHLATSLPKLILKGSPFKGVPVQELAVQIAGMKKAEKKLPSWFLAENIFYPPNINLEQTSSEITAKYKAGLTEGKKLIDITGGFGIDSYYFAERFAEVIHCELNPELSEIAAHNFKVLGRKNIKTKTEDAIEYLRNLKEIFDWIYIDPARRDDYGGKVFLLEQCTPDVPGNLELFFSKANKILVKTSPLLDLKAGIKELQNVAEIHIVAVNQEVKELIWILKKDSSYPIPVTTVHFHNNEVQFFKAALEDPQRTPFSLPLKFLYEPNPAIMKSGLFGELARKTETAKLHANSHLFTSAELQEFPGRRFKIKKIIPYHKKKLQKELKLKKANITTRNFPKSVADLRKEQKIEDGGDFYIFFTTLLDDEKVVIVSEKI